MLRTWNFQGLLTSLKYSAVQKDDVDGPPVGRPDAVKVGKIEILTANNSRASAYFCTKFLSEKHINIMRFWCEFHVCIVYGSEMQRVFSFYVIFADVSNFRQNFFVTM